MKGRRKGLIVRSRRETSRSTSAEERFFPRETLCLCKKATELISGTYLIRAYITGSEDERPDRLEIVRVGLKKHQQKCKRLSDSFSLVID